MGTIYFSFLPGNKSRPKTKCNFTFIPGFFPSINFFIPYGNIFLKKKLTIVPYWQYQYCTGLYDMSAV